MIAFLNMLFNSKTKSRDNKEWISNVKKVSKLSHDIAEKVSELSDIENELFLKNKNELYISVIDFLDLMSKDGKVTIKDIFQICKHASEISTTKTSIIEVYPIVEQDHIVLCPDIKECEVHKNYKGEKIKIVSVRL
jgi:hypothetical protein